MKQYVYAIKDSKAGTFSNPFYSINRGTAERSFFQAGKDPQTTISQYPEDFALYELGTFDDQSGEFNTYVTPEFVSNAVSSPSDES